MFKISSKVTAAVIACAMIICSAFAASAQEDLVFVSPDGQKISLSSLRGNIVVLLFSGIQDPQCRGEFQALESLVERYRGKSVRIYWVSIDSPQEASDERLKNPCGPAGPVGVLRDPNRTGFKKFQGRQLPTVVVLDSQGQLAGRPRGGFNPNSDFVNDLSAIIDKLLTR